MNKRTDVKVISEFLKHANREFLDGSNDCYYHHIAEGLYIVAANTEKGPSAKLIIGGVYGCGRTVPMERDGKAVHVEIIFYGAIETAAAYLYDEAKVIIAIGKLGGFINWRP